MSEPVEVKIERRPYVFHGSHYSSHETRTVVVCSCGWEKSSGFSSGTDAYRLAGIEHRLDHLEGKL